MAESKEITMQDVHSVIEKEITEWIELGEDNPPKVQEQIKVRVDTLRMLQGKFGAPHDSFALRVQGEKEEEMKPLIDIAIRSKLKPEKLFYTASDGVICFGSPAPDKVTEESISETALGELNALLTWARANGFKD